MAARRMGDSLGWRHALQRWRVRGNGLEELLLAGGTTRDIRARRVQLRRLDKQLQVLGVCYAHFKRKAGRAQVLNAKAAHAG